MVRCCMMRPLIKRDCLAGHLKVHANVYDASPVKPVALEDPEIEHCTRVPRDGLNFEVNRFRVRLEIVNELPS